MSDPSFIDRISGTTPADLASIPWWVWPLAVVALVFTVLRWLAR